MIVSFDQFVKQAGGKISDVKTVEPQVTPTQEQPGYLSRVGNELSGSLKGFQKTTERGAELMQEGKPIQGAVMSGLGAAGGVVRAAFSPLTAALEPVITAGLEKSGVLEKEKVQQGLVALDEWSKAHPDAAENLKNIIEVAGAKGATSIVSATRPVVENIAATTARAVKTGTQTVSPVVRGAVDITKTVTGGATRIPSRIATNVATKQAEMSAIKALPSQTAQLAARDGIDVTDIKDILKIPKSVKPQAKELAKTVSQFAKRETDVDPIEIVGKPIVAKLKQFESLRGKIGGKLGDVAENLPVVTTKELAPSIITRLKNVPGLSGLTVSKNGTLDFSKTTLASAMTKADRKAIQNAFITAVKGDKGSQKHKFRQELFEILGGKKKSLANITDTQEKALNAIRAGLSDVLESKNATYKSFSNQYRKVIQPLSEMRKTMKAIPEATEDVLDMSAGLLARRLTSTSISQGKIRTILGTLDKATKTKGNLLETTESLQKLYNILGRYYDISPKTGFQGQVKAGIEGTQGVGGMIADVLKKTAGQTPEVRQKALEKFLNEIL